MNKFNERLLGLFGISGRSKGKTVIFPTDNKTEEKPVTDTPASVTPVGDITSVDATVPIQNVGYSSTVDDVKLSTSSVAKMMEYTYGYRLKQIDGFVIENVTKHPNLNVVMYTMLHMESNTRIKIAKDVYEFLFEASGEKK